MQDSENVDLGDEGIKLESAGLGEEGCENMTLWTRARSEFCGRDTIWLGQTTRTRRIEKCTTAQDRQHR